MLKKYPVLLLTVLLGLSLAGELLAQEKFKVAIVMLNSRQQTYIEGKEGIISGFKKAGFDESRVEFDIRNAEDSKDKMADIAKDLKEKKVDLIMPLGSDAAVAISKQITDIPIVFSQVGDNTALEIAESLQSSGNNTTGTINLSNAEALINILKEIVSVKRLGVLYCADEAQSKLRMGEVKKLQAVMGFNGSFVNIKSPDEAEDMVKSLIGRIDSLYVGPGNTMTKSLDAIAKVAVDFKIPSIGTAPDRADKGILLAIGPSRFKLGELAAKKAIEVLGGKKPSDIPIESLGSYDLVVNLKTANAIGITVPASVLKKASRVIQ